MRSAIWAGYTPQQYLAIKTNQLQLNRTMASGNHEASGNHQARLKVFIIDVLPLLWSVHKNNCK